MKGTINFTQERFGAPVIIRGVISGLEKGKYWLNIHEGRDISMECNRIGPLLSFTEVCYFYMTFIWFFSPPKVFYDIFKVRYNLQNLGQLGYIESDSNTKAVVYFTGRFLSLSGTNNIIGRSLAVHIVNVKNSRIVLCGVITLIN